ncbi:hypothetical protein LTS16_005138 [Friedmanniomyces endolithicus]|nr:hypothetical protein LTR57_012109 [Friedmanniomyces endolithicus]KAK0991892.1 hypothetical protein LTS01_007981 [Friedmanniomyces endolithicus]KAK1047368.1 hypothetical protein LTS16_005138 [Friedmanniomyces endolithicus]
MPNLKLFKRRSSGSNALDSGSPIDPPPGTSSFRVLERPDRTSPSYRATPSPTAKSGRTFQSPLNQLRGKSADDLGLIVNRSVDGNRLLGADEALKRDRGSGGTTHSNSSGYYESSSASARHSSTSTLPSSVDQDREPDHDELYPRKARTTPMQQTVNANANLDGPLPAPPSFVARAGRAFSFGPKHNRSQSVQHDAPPLPTPMQNGEPRDSDESHSPQRNRSTTTSSYASTAKPPERQQEFTLGVTNFGDDFTDDFGNMFSGVGKSPGRSREDLGLQPGPGAFHRAESEPMYPPRTLVRQVITPSPTATRNGRDNSRYSFERRDSQDGLMTSSVLSSPRLFDDPPPVPVHGNGIAPAFFGKGKSGYSLVPERHGSPGLERTSSDGDLDYASDHGKGTENGYKNRQTQLDDGDRWGKSVERAPQQSAAASASNKSFTTTHSSSGATDRTLRAPTQASAGAISPTSDENGSLFGAESISTTPRAAKLSVHGPQGDSMFDSSPQGPPSRAVRPGHQRTESGTPRKMTKAQFELLQRSGESSLDHSEEETHEEEDDYDDGDDGERAKQIARQRRKQEATMAVYRQRMKKSTAGGLADLPAAVRPPMERAAASAPVLHLGGVGGTPPMDALRGKMSDNDTEDEDVPLGVLQAHGFPSSNRPPTRLGEIDGQRRVSVAGSVMGGGAGQGNLPPFARRLPQDPYFGSSLVSPANRESLAFSSAQSTYGGQGPQMANPGGLVGVIASEERAKASRRGSPNPITGTYGMPVPGQMPYGMPGLPRTMSMGSIAAPQVYTPSGYMPSMPQMPQMMPGMMPDQGGSAQMQQFMQMQMQLMQNMLTMQQQHLGQGTPQPQQGAQDYLGVPLAGNRPMSMASQAPNFQPGGGLANQGRAMTMMNPPPSWGMDQNALPRPTSAMPNSYAPSGFNVGIGGPGQGYTPSIAPSERSNVGMPSRYRPVVTGAGNEAATGRSHSMTSSMTLQAFTNQQGGAQYAPQPVENSGLAPQQSRSTIRLIDKPKGSPKVGSSRPVMGGGGDEEEEGWAEMGRKRMEKKGGWRKKDSKVGNLGEGGEGLGGLYNGYH